MKKKSIRKLINPLFLGTIILFSICTNLLAATTIPAGNVSGTWTLAGSPYKVTGTIEIDGRDTLTIDPGVTIEFQGHYKFNVLGKLLAIGTVTDTIIFTAANISNGWGGMRFVGGPSGAATSQIEYCKLQHSIGEAVYCLDSKVSIYNSFILNNLGAGIVASGSRLLLFHNKITNNAGGVSFNDWVSFTINNNIISNNSGDGISMYGSEGTINNNIISNNSGNGISCGSDSHPKIYNNTISNNSGRGITAGNCSPIIDHNTISNNSGGGIYCQHLSNPTITNTTISNNSAYKGGALYCSDSSFPTIRNCILWGNTASISGSQVYLEYESNPDFYYCNVQGDTTAFGVNGYFYSGNYQNNINADPKFVSPSGGSGTGFDGVTADWSLQASSPCINNGDPSGTYPATDKAGNPCVSGGRIDMGAYEYQSPPLTASITQIQQVFCFGDASAVLSVNPLGGTVPYSYMWNTLPAQTTQTATGLSAGDYYVTVTDANGVTNTASITITQPTALLVPAPTKTEILCNGGKASATSNPSGGTTPYVYTWTTSPVQTTNTATGLLAGTYTVKVTDANSCSTSASVTITQPALLVANAGSNKTVYYGYWLSACATLKGTATGGVAPYKYAWSTGIASATIWVCPSTAKQYTLTVTDANGCTSKDVVKVCVVDVRASGGKVAVCHKNSNGTFSTLNVSTLLVPVHLAHGDKLGKCGTIIKCIDAGKTFEEEDNLVVEDEINLTSYPNPFFHETTIRFNTVETGQVEVAVYNVLGIKVASIFNGIVNGLEIHEEKFNADNLSNGIYFVKLITEQGDMKVERIVLNR